MSALSRTLAPLALFLMISATGPVHAETFNDMSIDRLRASVTNEHPSAYYILSSKLFDTGQHDEAVFWFYAGQLRYRTHLVCNPDLPADADPALFGALSEVIGAEINAYAFGDLAMLEETIDKVIAWDNDTPNKFTNVRDCADAYHAILQGLKELKTYVIENAEEVRAQRAANGLENR